MSSVKITQLPNVLGNQINPAVDVLPIVRVGADSTDKITVEELGTLLGGGLSGTQYVYVAGKGTPAENGDELKAAYATAQTMSPSSTNRISVIVGPGKYFNSSPAVLPLADGQFEFSTNYIDVISLTGEPDVFLSGISVGGFSYIKGMNTSEALSLGGVQAGFNLIDSKPNQKIENCVGGNYSFGWGGNVEGTFINCVGGNYSFAYATSASPPLGITEIGPAFFTVDAAGTFINCTASYQSFGVGLVDGRCSGVFTNCIAGNESFGLSVGSFGGDNSGTFTNCKAGNVSFTGSFGLTSGIFNNCIAGSDSFGQFAYGTFNNCEAGQYSFGTGNAAGTFTYCKAGNSSFGSGSGIFTNCISGDSSFGASNLADGTYNNCIAGAGSFGSNYGPSISGKLYYCRLTSGSFQTVTGAGRTVYCIDGNDNPNNQ